MAGQSGDRIPVGARFSAPFQMCPRAHPAFYGVGNGYLSRGQSGRDMVLATHSHLVPKFRKEWSFISTPPPGPSRPILEYQLQLCKFVVEVVVVVAGAAAVRVVYQEVLPKIIKTTGWKT
jgi:hypothetical protein